MRTLLLINRPASLFTALALLLLAAGCGNGTPPAPPADSRPAVRTAEVAAVENPRSVRLPGVIRTSRRATLAFLQTGYLVERRAEPGDRVTTGTVLALVENAALEPAVAAANARIGELQARLAQLQRDADRLQRLHERGLVAAGTLESAEAERDATASSLDRARAERDQAAGLLSEARLIAPFDGVIGRVLAEPGDRVSAGEPVMTLLGEGRLEVELRLPETMNRAVVPDTTVTLTGVLHGHQGTAVIRHLGRPGEHGEGTPAILELADPTPFRAGQAVHAHVPVARETHLRVPVSAVMDVGGTRPVVWVVSGENRVRQVPVRTMGMDGHTVGARGELAAGDRVVTAGQHNLAEGMRVRVLP